jgi:hypothetical protein
MLIRRDAVAVIDLFTPSSSTPCLLSVLGSWKMKSGEREERGHHSKKEFVLSSEFTRWGELELRLQWSSENIRRSLFCDRKNYEGRGSSQLHSPNITNNNDQVTMARWREKLEWVIEAGMR